MPSKRRLDVLLVERGLCESRSTAQRLILAGKVLVDDHRTDKPSTQVSSEAMLRVESPPAFVSRGGEKLQGALLGFADQGLTVRDRVCIDIGASTGGFTDCLLQAGAARVHAVDVGYGQLAWKLASDPRVVVHDRTNIRKLDPSQIAEPIELAVADCSFISLTKVLPHLPALLAENADLVVLVKPQFEVGVERIGKGGIVRDDDARLDALRDVEAAAQKLGFAVCGRLESPIAGREGNREWLLWLRWPAPPK